MIFPITIAFLRRDDWLQLRSNTVENALESITYNVALYDNIDMFTLELNKHAQALSDTHSFDVSYSATMVKDEYTYLTGGVRWIEAAFRMCKLKATKAPSDCDLETGDICFYKQPHNDKMRITTPARQILGFSEDGVHCDDGAYWYGSSHYAMEINPLMTALHRHTIETGTTWKEIGQTILNTLSDTSRAQVVERIGDLIVYGIVRSTGEGLEMSHPNLPTLLNAYSYALTDPLLHNINLTMSDDMNKDSKLVAAKAALVAAGIIPQ